MLLSEGQMSDFKGAALMIDAFPNAKSLLGDKGHDAEWFRAAVAERKIEAFIPSKANRKVPIPHDTVLYRRRHKIENMFGRLKDWRRIHTRYDRCAHTFMSAICIAATVTFRDQTSEVGDPKSGHSLILLGAAKRANQMKRVTNQVRPGENSAGL
jgi:transposase